jgi:LmbE family N-acetylglucosaminyl deacetylase
VLTCIFAHPDDETFVTGATLARYAAAKIPCALYCATDGDAGRSSGIPVASPRELGALRRNELGTAARLLGVSQLAFGGHGDGTLATADPEPLLRDIVRFIRQTRPSIVVTFGPEGAPTGHRDHRAISRLATAAFHLAALPTEYAEDLDADVQPHAARRLYYTTWQVPAPGDEFPRHGLPVTASVDARPHNAVKMAAFMAHVSQRDHLQRFHHLAWLDAEHFSLAAGVPQPRALTDDLFAGL